MKKPDKKEELRAENATPSEMKPEKKKKDGEEEEPTADELRQMMKKNNSEVRGPGAGRMIREKPKNFGKTVGKLLRYIGKSKWLVLLIMVTTIVSSVLSSIGPRLQGNAINTMHMNEATQHVDVDFDTLVRTLVTMGIVYLAGALMQLFQGFASAKISQTTVYTLRQDLFRKISHLPISYTDTHPSGDIMSRMTNDVDNVSNAISGSLTSLISAVLTLVLSLYWLLRYDWRIVLVTLITIPLTVFLSMKLSAFMRKYFVRRQVLLGKMNAQVEEMVTGYKTVMAYGKEEDACGEFAEISEDFRKCSIKANLWGGVMGPLSVPPGAKLPPAVAGAETKKPKRARAAPKSE